MSEDMNHGTVHLTLRLSASKYLLNPNNMPGTLLAVRNSEIEDLVSLIHRNVTNKNSTNHISLSSSC